MSRIGVKQISVPAEAKVEISSGQLKVKGPKGEMTTVIPKGIDLKVAEGKLAVQRQGADQVAAHGLTRALAQNAITGVTKGFTRDLEIVGVGYRAAVAGRVAIFNLGYSHPIEVLMPKGVDIKVEAQTKVQVSGIDRQLVGETAAKIRALRPPDPYKNKGVRYADEKLRKKEGKTGAK
jgi:large subunit ribosomal protein L6